jgi:predicted DNA-binding transcriptional regulator AlpA
MRNHPRPSDCDPASAAPPEGVNHTSSSDRPDERKPRKKKGPLAYDPQSEIVRTVHGPKVFGLSEVSLWRARKAGRVPQPIVLGPNSKGWTREMIAEWRATQPRG